MTWTRISNRALLAAVCGALALLSVAGIAWAIGDAGHEHTAGRIADAAAIVLGVVWVALSIGALLFFWSAVDE